MSTSNSPRPLGDSREPGKSESASRHLPVGGRRAFIGRAREVAELEAALDDAISGRGAICLVAGEPGIGKTRLADEIGARAVPAGVRVLRGRCWEGGGSPANWPWIQALRSLATATDPATLRSQLGADAPYVSQLLPEIRELEEPGLPAPSVPLEPERARFYLFAAVTSFLRRASKSETVLFLLDDFHAADLSSLRLLQFLARELRDSRILLVVTYRDAEAKARATVGEILAEISREGRTIHLQGLSKPEVAHLIETTAEAVPSADLVTKVHQATGGNPFFIEGVVRVALAEHEPSRGKQEIVAGNLKIPEEVKESVRQRLGLLSEDARWLLTVAALIGKVFDRAVLEAAAEWPEERVLSTLAEGMRAALVAEDSAALGRYRFSHALVCETLAGDLAPGRGPALHRSIGEAIESVHAADLDAHAPELAHHFFEAIAAGDAGRAIEYAMRSARQAAAVFAWEEAIREYERALHALRPAASDDPRRMQILLELGDAQCRLGDLASSKETCLRALALARKTGAAVALARAVLGFCGEFVLFILYDDARVRLLEEALAALGDEEPALRARVLARLAREYRYTNEVERGRARYEEAVRVARRSGDRATLAATLAEWYIGATAAGSPIEVLVGASEEISQLAREVGDPDLVAWARLCRINALTEQGDMRALEPELEAYSALARRIRHRDHAWIAATIHVALELMKGRFDEAERLANETLALGQHAPRATVLGNYGLQLFVLRREQGRLAEIEPFLTRRSPSNTVFAVVFPSFLALLHAELGRPAEARSEFEQLAANGFADVPQTSVWPITIGNLSEVCCYLGDASRAAALYRLLLQYSGRNVTRGQAYASLYSADHYLGLLAATMSKPDEATWHFEAALALDARMGARPLLARAQCDYARMLLGSGSSAAHAKAGRLLEQAIATARKLGMASLVAKAEALGHEVVAASATPQEVGRSLFRREGDVWTIAHHGPSFGLRDMKGLQCISRLLREPGRQVHCFELLDDGRGTSPEDRDRLEDLQSELAEAEGLNDPGRATRAREQLDVLLSKLARAAGLGEKDPEIERAVERARVNVSRTIKDAIAKIREHDDALARHLANAIHTGVFCSYLPELGTPTLWAL